MKQQIMTETTMDIETTIVGEIEWQKWLTDYTALRSKAFLRILEETKRKS